MPLHHVRDLMRHHAGKLRLIVCGLDRAQIDEDGSTRKRKRIDLLHIHHVEAVRPLISRCMLGEPRPQPLHILRHRIRVRQDRQLFHDLRRILFSQLDFFLLREDVEPMRRLNPRRYTKWSQQTNNDRKRHKTRG